MVKSMFSRADFSDFWLIDKKKSANYYSIFGEAKFIFDKIQLIRGIRDHFPKLSCRAVWIL